MLKRNMIKILVLTGTAAMCFVSGCAQRKPDAAEVTAAKVEEINNEPASESATGNPDPELPESSGSYAGDAIEKSQKILEATTPMSKMYFDNGSSGESETMVHTYVIDKKSVVFHESDCKKVGKIKEKNREEFTGTRDELTNLGYKPCKTCKP